MTLISRLLAAWGGECNVDEWKADFIDRHQWNSTHIFETARFLLAAPGGGESTKIELTMCYKNMSASIWRGMFDPNGCMINGTSMFVRGPMAICPFTE
jgi:hypothetical protein